MDKSLRNTLRSTVTECRLILEKSVSEMLQGRYGVHLSGKLEDASDLSHLSAEEIQYRAQIVGHLDHIKAYGLKTADAVAQLARGIAFTHLNRICALKMMEMRGLIREAVSRGVKSNGFKFYLADHPEDEKLWTSGRQDTAYANYLEWLRASYSGELGMLFFEHDPANHLLPPQRVLDAVLDLINQDQLKDVWVQDETIGWIYQYFTPKELRDKVRKESAAPRNSYELAFRNQFYTPRYVVEFLVDNTLGRIWCEMRQGETHLKNICKYLVRRPNEVFLKEGESIPDQDAKSESLTQKELLSQPAHVPFRPKKDPRDLKILDPACGSGHLLLYCFDLLIQIYEEAYADPEMEILRKEFPEAAEFRRAIPGLILGHNLHGIDIDLRAVQIAGLALWMRAQRYFHEKEIGKEHRKITRSNIVCAEPMPGETDLLKEFTSNLEPKLLGQLVEVVFEKMKLAGEAGSLLKIEEELRGAIADAKIQWQSKPQREQLALWPQDKRPKAEQLGLFDVSGITDEEFWNQAERRVVEALQAFAEKAAHQNGIARRLFAEDAVRGFSFVDLCRKTYDVSLMNPPFGEASKPSKAYIEKNYPRTKNDVYAAFVERGLKLLEPRGLLGAITSRTGFFLSSFQKWREEILLKEAHPCVFADLGYGVLDTAMVETAAYCLERVD